jgi:hypothetical protein
VIERIHVAAIKHADGTVYAVPRPGRHHTVIAYMSEQGKPYNCRNEERHEQGFVTSVGRFVDREEACRIARAAGQILQKTGGRDTLYSEDVW